MHCCMKQSAIINVKKDIIGTKNNKKPTSESMEDVGFYVFQ